MYKGSSATWRVLVASSLVVAALVMVSVAGPAFDPTDQQPQVLGIAEVRERQAALSNGRTTSDLAAAPGLFRTPTVGPTAPRPNGVGNPTPVPRPTAEPSISPTPAQRPTPPGTQAEAEAQTSDPAQQPAQRGSSETRPDEPGAKQTQAGRDLSPGEASTTETGDARYEELRRDALALIAVDWPSLLPQWEVAFVGPREGVRGLTYTLERRIEIYVRDHDDAASTARVLAHELGHAMDLEHLNSAERDAWKQLRGMSSSIPWWPESGLSDFATGAGDFAECFASWQVDSSTLSSVAGPCGDAERRFLRDRFGS